MHAVRSARAFARCAWVALFVAILGLRLLTPAGFMPSFEQGSVTIVACPDGDPAPSPTSHHHGPAHKTVHDRCPYASASAVGGLAADFEPFLFAVLAFAGTSLLGRASTLIERRRLHDRPPLRGPPIPA